MFEGAEGILESSVSLVLLSSSKTLRRPTSLPLVLATFSAFRSIVGSLWRTATVDVSWFLAGGSRLVYGSPRGRQLELGVVLEAVLEFVVLRAHVILFFS